MPEVSTPTFDINRLIAEEDDQKRRVLLLLVNAFNENLAENTQAVRTNAQEVRDIGTKLDNHLIAFEERAARDDELRNQGKGAWKVLGWLLGIVQAVGLSIGIYMARDLGDIHSAIVAVQAADVRFESKLREHDSRLNALEKK